jgi:hypothetical protein
LCAQADKVMRHGTLIITVRDDRTTEPVESTVSYVVDGKSTYLGHIDDTGTRKFKTRCAVDGVLIRATPVSPDYGWMERDCPTDRKQLVIELHRNS